MQPNLSRLFFKGRIIILLSLCAGCRQPAEGQAVVGAIPLPSGYHRLDPDKTSFAAWLRTIPLKKDRTVYLYDGTRKSNQEAQFAVLDVSVGNRDLQQCADAVMRLRAEFFYANGDVTGIDFYTEQGVRLNFLQWIDGLRVRLSGNRLVFYYLSPGTIPSCKSRTCFNQYLETVFTYCGTRSLEKQLVPVKPFGAMQAGDVLIKGGAPGHAMLVMDMAEDAAGRRIYLLAQSYMPAQDIHIVNNPMDPGLSPWYLVDASAKPILTPEWTFYTNQLRGWPVRGKQF
jgi:hypothetical protein